MKNYNSPTVLILTTQGIEDISNDETQDTGDILSSVESGTIIGDY